MALHAPIRSSYSSQTATREGLEGLLRERKLDRTLTTTFPGRVSADEVAPFGVDALDALLDPTAHTTRGGVHPAAGRVAARAGVGARRPGLVGPDQPGVDVAGNGHVAWRIRRRSSTPSIDSIRRRAWRAASIFRGCSGCAARRSPKRPARSIRRGCRGRARWTGRGRCSSGRSIARSSRSTSCCSRVSARPWFSISLTCR